MRSLTLALLLTLVPQADPLDAVRRELGPAFTCERLETGIVIASDADADHRAVVKELLRKTLAAVREHAFEPVAQNTLVVCTFKETEGFRAYTSKRYSRSFELPAFYDVVQRRLLLHTEVAENFIPSSTLIYLLSEQLGHPLPAPWTGVAISILEEKPEDPGAIFDPRAALLRGAYRRGAVPPLRTLFGMNLETFRTPGKMGLHNTLATRFAQYLQGAGLLKRFFEQYRATFRKDATGQAALEAALGKKLDAIEKDFIAHVGSLRWIHEDRFRAHAKKAFSGSPVFRVDDDLFMAVAADVDEAAVTGSLDSIRKLKEPLIKRFDLQNTGLPILARLFKDESSLQSFAKIESPDRGYVAGYYIPHSRSISANMQSGGTFIHEFCHSLFEDDLGILPPWANEGLAALYEEHRIEDGVPVALRGDTIKDLKAALDAGKLPRLPEFVQMKGPQFWDRQDREKTQVHYELGRAILLYLQDKGKLVDFYRHMKATKAVKVLAPPITMCREALEAASGMKVAVLDEDFRRWVAGN